MRRRGFAKLALGTVAFGALAYWQRNTATRFALTRFSNGVNAKLAPEAGADVCVLTPEQTSGPYYVKSPLRSNITEGRPGLPLKLVLEIVKVPDCTAIEGATVEIWQCDARGYYSGYSKATVRAPFDTLTNIIINQKDGAIAPTDTETFMRGGQVTDANGLVEFETIFPGWYDPRVTHIHIKVSQGGKTFLTTQLYFPDELVADIYANHPDYKDFGPCPYNLNNDSALRDLTDQTGVVLKTTRSENSLSASARFGIA
jgi:protocatechuate 3,4-dioxygenase beta subunit